MKKIAVLATLCLASQAHAAKWDKLNSPFVFNSITKVMTETNFSRLPMSAKLKDDRLAWSENFWPSNKGGIAYRWNSANPQPFHYHLNTKEELKQMSEAELAELSPAELYDISQNDYQYTLTTRVLSTYNENKLWWEGICHGWALAAVNYPEPAPVSLVNKDGIKVHFGSSDVKGLLAMHDAFNSKGRHASVGGRCGAEGKVAGEAFDEDGDVPVPSKVDAEVAECADTNAGTFHLVITNMIGINSKGFVADVDRFNDVWNQPVYAYESQVVEEKGVTARDVKDGVSRKVRVKTTMFYGDELEFFDAAEAATGYIGFVSKLPVTGTPAQQTNKKEYDYVLELNSRGDIVGGEWISETRPDFLWTKVRDEKFTSTPGNGNGLGGAIIGLFKKKYPLEGLNQIYKPIKR